MEIGKVVSSSSHIDYICQIFSQNEARTPVQPADYALNTFVGLEQPSGGILVGLITNTMLFNPEYGNLGPKLAPREEMVVFSPDYLAEKVTLLTITLIGSIDAEGVIQQGVPETAAQTDTLVCTLEADTVNRFHHPSGQRLVLGYLSILFASTNPVTHQLLPHLVHTLGKLFPTDAPRLNLLSENLAWKTHIEPLG
ncbi:MAG: hypothetical protein ACYCZF_11800 [Anaerolineae bacterium]